MPQPSKPFTILLADDDPDDRMLCKEALEQTQVQGKLGVVEDGEELMNYLKRRGKYADPAVSPRPTLILLDLNMPRKDGREALREIKQDSELKRIPVIVFTTSKAEEDVYRTYDLGVNSFITKPLTFAGLVDVMNVLSKYWFEIVKLPTPIALF